MARPRSLFIRDHRIRDSSRLANRIPRYFRPAHTSQEGGMGNVGRNLRYYDQPVSFLLASNAGSRGAEGGRTKHFGPTKRRNANGNPHTEVRRGRRYLLLEHGDVFHHPHDSIHLEPQRKHSHRNIARCSGSITTACRQIGDDAICRRHHRCRNVGHSHFDRFSVICVRGIPGLASRPGPAIKQARSFYMMVLVSTVVAVVMDFANISPIKALYWTAIINGVLAPFLLVGILIVAADVKLMNGQPSSKVGKTTVAVAAAVMFIAAFAMFWL